METKYSLFVIILFLIISSCSKDDSTTTPDNSNLIGKWKGIHFTEELYSLPDTLPFPGNTTTPYLFQNEIYFDFQPQNIFKVIYSNTSTSGYSTYSGTYNQNGNKIIINKYEDLGGYFGTNTIYIDSLTTNRLIIRDTTVNNDIHILRVKVTTCTK